MRVLYLIRAAEWLVTSACIALAAIGDWAAIFIAIPGVAGLLISAHHYKSRDRGQRDATRF